MTAKKIRLGLDVRTMSPAGSGIGRYEIELTKSLVKQLDPGRWELVLFPGPEADFSASELGGISVNAGVYGTKSVIKRAAYKSAVEAIREKIDIFHSLDFVGPAWKYGFKLVHTIHDIIPAVFPKEASKRSKFICRFIMPSMFLFDDAIITPSEHTKKDIVDHFGIKPGKITVTPLAARPGLDTPCGAGEIKATMEKYSITKKYFLFLGTLEPKKNAERIGDAFIKVHANHPDIQMVFAGKKGWLVDGLYEKAKSVSDIIFTGFVDDAGIKPLLKGAYGFIFPSVYEGFGLPVADALSAGTACITSNTTSLPEVAGDAALYADPYSVDSIALAMERLITEPGLKSSLEEKGTARAKAFSWQKTAEETIKVYEKVLNIKV